MTEGATTPSPAASSATPNAEMEYRTLGSTGLRVSAIGYGGAPLGLTNYLGEWSPTDAAQRQGAIEAIHRALEVGVTYFDTALAYGDGESERILGEARRAALAQPALRQRAADMLLATKVPGKERSYEGVLRSAETSLKNLGVDRVDVLQLHGSVWRDGEVEQVLTGGGLDALQELKRQGKARFIGFTSETPSPGTYQLLRSGAFDVLQIAYNVMYGDACNLMVKHGPILEAADRGMGVVTMRSLSSGVFQKVLQRYAPDVDGYALALQFILSNPYVHSALVGMRTADEVNRNARLVADAQGRMDLDGLHQRYV
jgi:uncharacterized protein